MKTTNISDKLTCNVMIAGKSKTPAKITLLGDKHKRPESAQHVIEFPGGAIEVSRTSDGNYWAHILVNRQHAVDDCDGFRGHLGQIIGSRIENGQAIEPIPGQERISQVAILIKPL